MTSSFLVYFGRSKALRKTYQEHKLVLITLIGFKDQM